MRWAAPRRTRPWHRFPTMVNRDIPSDQLYSALPHATSLASLAPKSKNKNPGEHSATAASTPHSQPSRVRNPKNLWSPSSIRNCYAPSLCIGPTAMARFPTGINLASFQAPGPTNLSIVQQLRGSPKNWPRAWQNLHTMMAMKTLRKLTRVLIRKGSYSLYFSSGKVMRKARTASRSLCLVLSSTSRVGSKVVMASTASSGTMGSRSKGSKMASCMNRPVIEGSSFKALRRGPGPSRRAPTSRTLEAQVSFYLPRSIVRSQGSRRRTCRTNFDGGGWP